MSLDQFIGKFCVIRRAKPAAQYGSGNDGIYFVTDQKEGVQVCAVKCVVGDDIHIHHDFFISDRPEGYVISECPLFAEEIDRLKANLKETATLGSMGREINERAKARLMEIDAALATRAKLDALAEEAEEADAIKGSIEDVSEGVEGFELPEGCTLQVTFSFPVTDFDGAPKNVYCHTSNAEGTTSQLLLIPTV